ncbi:tyrosine-type recombinase/integrase [Rhodococcus sp. BE178]|uniref:tyrosine-type recombinase/integrase n=1 Tax=Rhodococcus sp. BE178 TaxID=2817737 RepID=UPI003D24E433
MGDVDLPARSLNPNARPKPGTLRVERTVITVDGALVYDTPKTRGSRRRVPLTPATVDLLRDYLARHPRADEPTAPLFPSMRLVAQKPTGLRATDETGQRVVPKAEDALAALTVDEAEARLTRDWDAMLRHQTFYKAVFRPAVLRANRIAAEQGRGALAGRPVALPPGLKFHALRHTYASLCVAAGIPPLELARFMGHAKITTTLSVYAHLFEDDHADAMAALGAMGQPATPPRRTGNVVPMRAG